MHMDFKEPHIKKIYIIQKHKYQNKIQLAFQVTKFFILEVYVDIFILT